MCCEVSWQCRHVVDVVLLTRRHLSVNEVPLCTARRALHVLYVTCSSVLSETVLVLVEANVRCCQSLHCFMFYCSGILCQFCWLQQVPTKHSNVTLQSTYPHKDFNSKVILLMTVDSFIFNSIPRWYALCGMVGDSDFVKT